MQILCFLLCVRFYFVGQISLFVTKIMCDYYNQFKDHSNEGTRTNCTTHCQYYSVSVVIAKHARLLVAYVFHNQDYHALFDIVRIKKVCYVFDFHVATTECIAFKFKL